MTKSTSDQERGATACVESPATPDGAALSIVALRAVSRRSMDEALERLRLAPLAVGAVKLADLLGVDHGIAVRWSDCLVHLTPHGGALIIQRLLAALSFRGVPTSHCADSLQINYPEAVDLIEACALDALARAPSPRAVDVILRQRALWQSVSAGKLVPLAEASVQANLDRLLRPPTVVMLGAPNIGKSTLTNALAGRLVSIVADEPGVTRDHVGVTLDLDGLTVRVIDCPGIGSGSASGGHDAEAQRIATLAARQADLLLLCADPISGFPDVRSLGLTGQTPTVRVGLRSDLGSVPGSEIEVSALAAKGLGDAALAIRHRLLPEAALETQERWRFHPSLPPERPPG